MGNVIIDRRGIKSTSDNRQRFLKKTKKNIIESLPDIISEGSMDDLTSKKGNVKIPIKNISEPEFSYDHTTGDRERILPGNKRFSRGDKIMKPDDEDGGRARQGSNDPTVTEDNFNIIISKEEFIKYFFEDMELPDMIKKSLSVIDSKKFERSGFSNDGSYNNLNVVKTYKKSLARRISIAAHLKKLIEELSEQIKKEKDDDKRKELEEERATYEKRLKSILFFDNIDLAYNFYEVHPKPITKAAMFMIMDVSGSMGEEHKDIAKRFFMLLYLFLKKNYQKVDLIFIRHHSQPKEVSEFDFFNSIESGGTIVFPALEMCNDIIKERYSSEDINLYCCQCSDGDVWDKSDANDCKDIIENELLKKLQFMAYIDIQPEHDALEHFTSDSSLYNKYSDIDSEKFVCEAITSREQIWHVFKHLFSKKEKE